MAALALSLQVVLERDHLLSFRVSFRVRPVSETTTPAARGAGTLGRPPEALRTPNHLFEWVGAGKRAAGQRAFGDCRSECDSRIMDPVEVRLRGSRRMTLNDPVWCSNRVIDYFVERRLNGDHQ